jgi:hypothetical protein
MPTIKGKFEIQSSAEPPYDVTDGVTLGRMRFDKQFSGPLEAKSVVQMTYARTPVQNSAGYVAVERIEGTVEGRQGSFVVLHTGLMDRGVDSLTITVVPDSATGALSGMTGTMRITIVDRQHFYELDYSLP